MFGRRGDLVAAMGLAMLCTILAVVRVGLGVDNEIGLAFVGSDVHFEGKSILRYRGEGAEQVLVFRDGFSMSAGARRFASDSAVVWVRPGGGKAGVGVKAKVAAYLEGKISVSKSKGVRQVGLHESVAERGRSMVVGFESRGEVFVTVEEVEAGEVRGLALYGRGFGAVEQFEAGFGEEYGALAPFVNAVEAAVERPGAEVKGKEVEAIRAGVVKEEEEKGLLEQTFGGSREAAGEEKPSEEGVAREKEEKGFLERIFGPRRKAKREERPMVPEVKVRYPVNVAPAGAVALKIESAPAVEGLSVATVRGRFYLWQKQDETGGLLEVQADGAVLYYSGEDLKVGQSRRAGSGAAEALAQGAVKSAYVCGDVVMAEGQRTIRADEMYYDFENKRGIAINAEMRSFDAGRGIPIYVRAAELRQLDASTFSGEDIVLTTSEFYVPQVSLGASRVLITDRTVIDERLGKVSDSSYEAQMRDVRFKVGERTIFGWPYMRSNLERPDVPIKSVRVGHDNQWGTSVESRWHLSRLLGLAEPEGTDGTFELDYYSERGVGAGVRSDYASEDHFGRMSGYIIDDRGEDRLGRDASRRGLEPPRELRGRFSWVHREFMPYNWQVTTGVNYESDENFVESYYRREYNVGIDRETYIHMKRIEDNWGLAFLGKGRINDFSDELEEMPSAEFHLTGESIFEDKLTLYSDSFAGQFRQRIGDEHTTMINGESFGFVSHRSELDMPIQMKGFKAVPFFAGTFGYDDRSGFTRSLVDGTGAGGFNEDTVWIGEAGVRLSSEYWKVYRHINSRLWDLHGLRHVVRPELTAVAYAESDRIVRQHDVVQLGLSQRLQTKRGPAEKQRTVDWMRLDTAFTLVNDSEKDIAGAPDRLLWNRAMTPLRIYSRPGIFNGDLASGLKRFELFGPRRNYFSADYIWRMSDTSVLLSDVYYDLQEGVVEQFDVGFTRSRWPDLSYYVGSRYLRNVNVLDEEGSNAFVFAATYVFDPRYTLVFSQQYDFDYGANIGSDITLIRRYHRVFWGLTFSTDGSLDRQSVVLSIWPEGVPELAIGTRRYMGITGPGGY